MSGKEMRLLHLTDLHMRHALAGSADRLKRLSRDIRQTWNVLRNGWKTGHPTSSS